jgi:PPM family protein phosphatase
MNAITSMFLERGNPEMQDRAEIIALDNRTMFVVADGAGGISGGAQAADLFVRSVREAAPGLASEEGCCQWLHFLDHKIAEANDCGETTGIVVMVRSDGLFGASVGDSAAWLFTPDSKQELTAGQSRKPFLGTGVAYPREFVCNSNQGTLVVATDGLWKYNNLESIEKKVRTGHPENLAGELAELAPWSHRYARDAELSFPPTRHPTAHGLRNRAGSRASPQ